MRKLLLLICSISVGLAGSAWAAPASAGANAGPAQRASRDPYGFTVAALKQFTALHPIDTHTHVYQSDPSFTAMLQHLNVHIVDMLVADPTDTQSHRTFDELHKDAWQFVRSSAGHASLSTTFDPFDWDSPGFPKNAIASLNRDFAQGAVGMTFWSNPGMAIKDAAGNPVLPDNPRLEPVYKELAARHKPLLAHLSAADEDWGAAAAQRVPDVGVNLPVPPLLRARDNIAQQNPQLRVIGVHLGSVKEGLPQIAQRLDEHPNMAIDTAGRVDSLMAMPQDQVRAFLLKYQDRILYATDNAFRQNDHAARATVLWESRYAVDWRYFSSGDTFEYHGRQVHGLQLPASVLRKLYHDNAAHWIPGITR